MRIVFKPIAEHPNYEINRLGEVRNQITGNILKPYDDGYGYLRVKLDGKCCRLHILVAQTFIPNPDNKPVVNLTIRRERSMIAGLHSLNGSPKKKTCIMR